MVVYVDDIIFKRNCDEVNHKFSYDMSRKYEMSMIGEFPFFHGLQITQSQKGIFITQSKYLKEVLNNLGMVDCALFNTLMKTSCKLNKEDASPLVDSTL